MANTIHLQQALSILREILSGGDVRAAVKYLNSLTPHRFTGLYRFDDPQLKNLYMVDKEHPDVESVPDVPVTATYCAFTRKKGVNLTINDSMADESLTEHPARDEIRSYTGVPLLDEHGNVFGTICHFDYNVVPTSDENVELLEAIAPLLRSGRPAL